MPVSGTLENVTYDMNMTTPKGAHDAIDTVKSALEYISKERGRMGAYERRLEHAYNNLTVSGENLTAAESRIRDTDMADEITGFTKNNILSQASQSMLAQANSIHQNVLRLLQP